MPKPLIAVTMGDPAGVGPEICLQLLANEEVCQLATPVIFGDALDRVVTWKGGNDVSRLAGQPVRLRFVLRDADLYALQFQ